MKNILYAYKSNSASAKLLSKALGLKRAKHEGDVLECDILINWGSSRIKRDILFKNMLNHPLNVSIASNKLETFKELGDWGGIPKWTEDAVEASRWLLGGESIMARFILNGHSGAGIKFYGTIEDMEVDGDLPVAPLYVKYIPKVEEYRIHVFDGKSFFVQRKARKKDIPGNKVNWKIRNHANGFIFAHKDVDVPDVAKRTAEYAVNALGLDFGAVDIIQTKDNFWYVLEVNTAPGIEGTSVEKYAEQFKKVLK